MGRRIFVLLAMLAPLAAVLPAKGAPPAAQESTWLAWIGCWEGSSEVGGDDRATFVVCFRPLTTGSGVEIRTYTDGALVSTEPMIADGAPHAVEDGGCTGERTANWSRDGARVFLSSELDCGGGVMRNTRGLLSVLPEGGGWVEVQSVRAGDGSPLVGIRTFVPASDDVISRGPILDPSAGLELAVATARSQAGGPLTPDALVEIVERTGADVTNAYLIERGEPFGLDGERLLALSGRGVPGEVVDVMVAVSYPERFQVSGGGEESGEITPVARPAGAAPAGGSAWPRRRSFRGYSPWGLGYDPYWDPYRSSSYRFGYGSYGYRYGGLGGAYGYGYGGLGGVYRAPTLVFIEPPTVTDRATLSRNGGVVRRGATSSGSDSGASRSPPRTSGASRAAPRSSGQSSPARAAPSASRGSSGSGGGGSSGNVRRARPR